MTVLPRGAIPRALDPTAADTHPTSREWFDALIHDKVLAALLIAAQPPTPARIAGAAALAREGLDLLAGAPRRAPLDVGDRLREVAGRLGLCASIRASGRLADPRLAVGLIEASAEALANVRRHAGTDRVQVEARFGSREGRIRIRDEGRGFDPDLRRPGHLGVDHSIRARMRAIGGAAVILSAPGAGTTVTLSVPVAPIGTPAFAPMIWTAPLLRSRLCRRPGVGPSRETPVPVGAEPGRPDDIARHLAALETGVQPLLREIAAGREPTEERRRAYARAEAAIRDALTGAAIVDAGVRAVVAAARERSVQITLMARGERVEGLERLRSMLLEVLPRCQAGMTVRVTWFGCADPQATIVVTGRAAGSVLSPGAALRQPGTLVDVDDDMVVIDLVTPRAEPISSVTGPASTAPAHPAARRPMVVAVC